MAKTDDTLVQDAATGLSVFDLMSDPDICYIREGEADGKKAWLILDSSGETLGAAPSEAAALLAARDHGLDVQTLN